MKRITIYIAIILIAAAGLIYADQQTEDGLIEELRILLTPDPMEHNTYDSGECTYHVFDKVKADGSIIDRGWGNAEHWANRARADDYRVDDTPKEGSIMQTTRGEIGHVAYIEKVHEDGSFDISEMNFTEPYKVTERTIESETAADYQYIHPKLNKHADKD